ncbi:MAG: response regulator [Hyphomonadaceae bacterium]
MRLHFVDDCATDSHLVSQLFSNDCTVSLRTSSRLQELLDENDESAADCIFLDVMRPDSVSMRDDVDAVRARTPAPIFFVTGGEAPPLRPAALDAGAEGLIEKQQLTREVVLQLAHNALVRSQSQRTTPQLPPLQRRPTVARVAPARRSAETRVLAPVTRALADGLNSIRRSLDDQAVNAALRNAVIDASNIASGLDRFIHADPHCIERCDILSICAKARPEIDKAARRIGASVFWDVRPGGYAQIGSSEQAVEGLKHFMFAVTRLMGADSTILVVAEPSEQSGGVVVRVYGTGLMLPSNWDSLEEAGSVPRMPDQARASLALAMRLLGATREQIQISQQCTTSVITLHL